MSKNRITLGEIKTDETSNEITDVTELLDVLELKMLKTSLCDDVPLYFEDFLLNAADFGRICVWKKIFHTALSIPSPKYVMTGEK